LDNESVPRRVRPSWPKNNATKIPETLELSNTIQEQEQDNQKSQNSEETFRQAGEKPQEQKIADEGKSIVINEVFSNRNASSDDTGQFHGQSELNGISGDGENKARAIICRAVSYKETSDDLALDQSYKQTIQECSGCLELQDKVNQLTEALQKTSIPTADQLPPSEFEFAISKDKYNMVIDAMDRSKSAIFVKCDGSKKFVRVIPDVDN
jgi:hypothetical protein